MPQHLPTQYKPPHVNITEQRGEGCPLRDASLFVPCFCRATLTASAILFLDGHHDPLFDQMEHMPVADASRHRGQQFRMRNAAKVVGQVGIYDVPISRVEQAVNVTHRVMRVAPLPVRILFRLQVGLEDR